MISVIDMPPAEESVWWRGKRGFQVGFFPNKEKKTSSHPSHEDDDGTEDEGEEGSGDNNESSTTYELKACNRWVPQALHPHPLGVAGSRCAPSSPLQRRAAAPTKPVLRKHGKLIAFFRSFILSRPSRRKLKRQGILKERVFGCDLGEHLSNSGHNLPMVLKCCAEFIESHGTVDGIYRLSGITSNIQKLRNAFDEDRIPDLYGDESILQDIHCVGSVLKMYFRELPNPLLTYQLYESFVAAVTQSEEERLLHVRDVVRQLPPPNSRTLEYLIRHLARVACHSSETGMTPKNIAIVWAPNLLRCKELEEGGVAALQVRLLLLGQKSYDVGTQAVVTEYLIRYVELIFCEQKPSPSPRPIRYGTHLTDVAGTPKKSRPKSLAISTPTKLLTIEEARLRVLTAAIKPDQKYIEVGGGPQSLPKNYHTVIELPNRKGGSLKQKKSPLGWKNIFSKGRTLSKQTLPELQHDRKISAPFDLNLTASAVATPEKICASRQNNGQTYAGQHRGQDMDTNCSTDDPSAANGSINDSPIPSPRTHNRSVSHDSYFNLLERDGGKTAPREGAVAEEGESDLELSPESSKMFIDISELNIDFNTSEAEMKIFSEDETLKSTSIEGSLSRSTLDMENLSMESGSIKTDVNSHIAIPVSKSVTETREVADELANTGLKTVSPVPAVMAESFPGYSNCSDVIMKNDVDNVSLGETKRERNDDADMEPLLMDTDMETNPVTPTLQCSPESSQIEEDNELLLDQETSIKPISDISSDLNDEAVWTEVTHTPIDSETWHPSQVEKVPVSPITQSLQRHKTSPDIPKPHTPVDNSAQLSKEAEDVPYKAKSGPVKKDITNALIEPEDEAIKRERIEKYKEERRMILREKFKSESFRGQTNMRFSGARKGPEIVADKDDVSVKDLVSVWGKDDTTSKSPTDKDARANKVASSATLSKPSAVSQQQRKIRDMAAMFEGPCGSSTPAPAGPPTKIMRQSSREGK
ncbi:hypothetical protein HAZT_HAZT001976 [Hyalella azteca]|uniref:Rho-GAP domain-containing protein n=1 Tax=Hyalella azteca TaxID=294128 RepID=A0A6A0GXA3_HYAAZ|nr:hypothetical protein HAZT_HAZT001976 [Hyalella azteca]